jgi:hypothetical protein
LNEDTGKFGIIYLAVSVVIGDVYIHEVTNVAVVVPVEVDEGRFRIADAAHFRSSVVTAGIGGSFPVE